MENQEVDELSEYVKYVCVDCGHKFIVKKYIHEYTVKYTGVPIYCPRCNSVNTHYVGEGRWETVNQRVLAEFLPIESRQEIRTRSILAFIKE